MKTYQSIKADVYRYYGKYSFFLLIKAFFVFRTFRPVFSLRVCQLVNQLPTIIRAFLLPCSIFFHRCTTSGAGVDLPWKCKIGPGFRITHGWGLNR